MRDSRTAILERIRSGRSGAPVQSVPVPVSLSPRPAMEPSVVVDQFVREAEAVGAIVHRTDGRDIAVESVLGILADAGVNRFVSWEPADLPIPELVEAVIDRGIRLVEAPSLAASKELVRDWTAVAGAEAGLTGAVGGLADTGTVILRSGPGRARLAWLLPPLHVVVLHSPFIYPTLQAFMGARGEMVGRSSHVAFVTGPSRTADIEQTLTIGVHGPKEVRIVLVDHDRDTPAVGGARARADDADR